MLKEGWDVTNVYTIAPLREAAAAILTDKQLDVDSDCHMVKEQAFHW